MNLHLRVAAHASDADLALHLMRNAERPVGRDDLAYTEVDTPLTAQHIEQLARDKRYDLIEIIAAHHRDRDLLDDIARIDLPVAPLRGLITNRRLRVVTLMTLSQDRRAGVRRAAGSTIAHDSGHYVRDAHTAVSLGQRILTCPDRELTGPHGVLVSGANRTSDWLNALALYRPEGVSEGVKEILIDRWLHYDGHRLGRALGETLPIDEALTLLRRAQRAAARTHLVSGLAGRRSEMNHQQSSTLALQHFNSTWHIDEDSERIAELLQPSDLKNAVENRTSACDALARVTPYDGLLEELDQHIAQRDTHAPTTSTYAGIREWISNGPRGPISLLANPAIGAERHARAFEIALDEPALLPWLVRNPLLDSAQQQRLSALPTKDLAALSRHIMRNPNLGEELLNATRQAVRNSGSTWARTGPAVALAQNAALPREWRLAISPLELDIYGVSSTGTRVLTHILEEHLGSDTNAWDTALALLPGWSGSLGDLIAAAQSL